MRRSAPQAYCGSTPVTPSITDSLLHSWDTFPLFVEADSCVRPYRASSSLQRNTSLENQA